MEHLSKAFDNCSDATQRPITYQGIAHFARKRDIPLYADHDVTMALFPTARQVLDDYHCADRVHKVIQLTRHYHDEIGWFLGELKRMETHADDTAYAMAKLSDYLDEHRHRMTYGNLRHSGYLLGSGGIKSANKFICHVRLKRSGTWW